MNKTEPLVLWYLRFNGYFAIPNFTTHPNFKKQSGSSDADVLAVRFQYSDERQQRFEFERDQRLIREVPIDFIIGEVKSSACALNDKWTQSDNENVEYALRWIGRWKEASVIKSIAKEIYTTGEWHDDTRGESVRFLCFGKTANEKLRSDYPAVSQLPFDDIIGYMRSRMMKGCVQIHRERWETFIIKLGELFEAGKGDEEVLEWILGGSDATEARIGGSSP